MAGGFDPILDVYCPKCGEVAHGCENLGHPSFSCPVPDNWVEWKCDCGWFASEIGKNRDVVKELRYVNPRHEDPIDDDYLNF